MHRLQGQGPTNPNAAKMHNQRQVSIKHFVIRLQLCLLLWHPHRTIQRTEECLTLYLQVVVGLPSITLLLCDLGVFGLEPYYLVTMLSPLYLSLSLLMSYVADVLEPRNRATGFALILGGLGLGLSIAPAIAIFLSTQNTLILGSAMAVLSPIWAIFFMKESLSPENRIRSDKLSCMNPFSPMAILLKTCIVFNPRTHACGVCTGKSTFSLLFLCVIEKKQKHQTQERQTGYILHH